jgi:hypothetical protein
MWDRFHNLGTNTVNMDPRREIFVEEVCIVQIAKIEFSIRERENNARVQPQKGRRKFVSICCKEEKIKIIFCNLEQRPQQKLLPHLLKGHVRVLSESLLYTETHKYREHRYCW